MLVRQIPGILDREISFTLIGEEPVAMASRRLGINCPVGLVIDRPSPYIMVAMNDRGGKREVKIFSESLGARSVAGTWILKEGIERREIGDAISRLVSIPSVVVGPVVLANGTYHATFYYSSCDSERVSEISLEIFSGVDGLDLTYMGPARDPVQTLRSESVGHSFFYSEFTCKPADDVVGQRNIFGRDWVRIVKGVFTGRDLMAIYRPDGSGCPVFMPSPNEGLSRFNWISMDESFVPLLSVHESRGERPSGLAPFSLRLSRGHTSSPWPG